MIFRRRLMREDDMTQEQDPKKAPSDGPGGAESTGEESGSGYDRPGGGSPESGGKQSGGSDSDPKGSSPEESSESADEQADIEK